MKRELTLRWVRTFEGWRHEKGMGRGWLIRGKIMGRRIYWLYRDGLRFTPTGRFEDAVSFSSVAAAKRFVEDIETKQKLY